VDFIKFFKKTSKPYKKEKTNSTCSISKHITSNINRIRNEFDSCEDLVISYYELEHLKCAFLYFKCMTDKSSINTFSLELKHQSARFNKFKNIEELVASLSGIRPFNKDSDFENLLYELMTGNTVILINGYEEYYSIATKSDKERAIEEPSSQTTIRGPKEGFTENISNNKYLIKKRIYNKNLIIENLNIGSITKTQVCLMYIVNIAKEEIVEELRRRLKKIELDSVLDGGYIEELIKDDPYSIFPTFLSTEKPDAVTASLLEGKIAILIDGTPFALTAPAIMLEFLHASEDHYHHFIISSLMRLTRFVALLLTLFVPSGFIAITTFHPEIIPTTLLVRFAEQREGVPLPTFFEALIMEFTFEILREAGIRMPRAIGPAISIVGALVIGQAAVDAGLISAAMVIVVSVTAICSFAIPNYEMSNAIRALRFALMPFAAVLGLYGVFMGAIIILLHLCKIKSISVPYLTPIAPWIKGQNKDTILKFPIWKMKYRPVATSGSMSVRNNGERIAKKDYKNKQEFR
jgi:spore germination protein KA